MPVERERQDLALFGDSLAIAWDKGWKALEAQIHEQSGVYWFEQPNPYCAALNDPTSVALIDQPEQ